MRILVAWIGNADLRGPTSDNASDSGPIAQAVAARQFDRLVLLFNQDPKRVEEFVAWLKARTAAEIQLEPVTLSSPTNIGEIYPAAVAVLEGVRNQFGSDAELTFHLSPGTPAMAVVWILLGK